MVKEVQCDPLLRTGKVYIRIPVHTRLVGRGDARGSGVWNLS